jgi:two-component system invasion response regulator UvrY
MKNILIADTHPIVRTGIKYLVTNALMQANVDEAGDEQELIRCIQRIPYHLIMLDINMPNTDFCRLMQWIKVAAPDAHVLVFTVFTEEIYGPRCLQLGAKGFLTKTASREDIQVAINRVLNGEKYISSRFADAVIAHQFDHSPDSGNPFDVLSQREMEIAIHLERGKSLVEICTIMNIQYSTANTYKRRIFEKLHVRSVLTLSRLMQLFRQ